MDNAYLIAALWMGLALLASLISIRIGISVALVEIGLGVVGGNVLGPPHDAMDRLPGRFGAVLLTFLAGAEIDPDRFAGTCGPASRSARSASPSRSRRPSLVAYYGLGWDLHASEIAGLALSTTSVAVVYAVMIESGLAAAGARQADPCRLLRHRPRHGPLPWPPLRRRQPAARRLRRRDRARGAPRSPPGAPAHRRVPDRVSEPEIKFLFLVLFLLGGLAQVAGSEAVLPAYLIGLAVAGVFVADRVLVHRMRATAFSLLTPFYFLKAGSLVSVPAIVAGAGLIALFLAVKVGAKVIGVWPTARAIGLPTRDATYTTLLMSTGLTFGTIAALYGLTNGYIDQPTYTILVTVVILSAVVPTLIATTFFEPEAAGREAFEDFEAAEEIDAGPLRLPPHAIQSTELTPPAQAAIGERQPGA